MKKSSLFAILVATAGLIPPASALTLQIDYSYDIASYNFFGSNPTARTALEKAVSDIEAAITTVLGPILSNQVVGSNGATTANFTITSFLERDPATGADITIPFSSILHDTVTLYVGAQPLNVNGSGNNILGVGASGGYDVSYGGSGFPSQFQGAVDNLNATASSLLTRGGPVFYSVSQDLALGDVVATISVDLGLSTGHFWFDIDVNNDGTPDLDQLENYWHFDAFSPVAANKFDLYTVALHEILHALGIGSSKAWDNNVSGTDWLGNNVIELLGHGNNVLSGDSSHINQALVSTRLSDGQSQLPVMTPSVALGTRRELTELDLAFLRDIGWNTVMIPEPSTAAVCLLGFTAFFRRRRVN